MSEVQHGLNHGKPTGRSVVVVLLITAFDTTWRIFAPLLAGLFGGLGLDQLTGKAPLFTIILLITGIVVTVWLVALQLRHVQKGKII